jgi:signal transduction histidine kinase
MLPQSLSKRVFLAFAALGVAMLFTVSASLFVVLRQAHRDDIQKSLVYEVAGVEASLLANPVSDQTQYETRIKRIAASIVDDGGFILVQGPRGLVRTVAGNPSSSDMPPPPAAGVKNSAGRLTTSDGNEFVYIESNANVTGGSKFLFAVPDNSTQQALTDILRTLSIIVVVLLLVGIPIAWLLARSVTAPMRRLAQAARDLPTASVETGPLPLEGPTEVKALTERFNAMAHEIAAIRHEETALLANLRHDLRTPLTSIAGFAEAIADGTASGERATAAARTIAGEAQRLDRLVGELGVVERLRDGAAALRPEALDAAELLAQAADRFGARASAAGVEIEVTAGSLGEHLVFTGDRLAVERVLQNLMENALSVLPSGGHVWLRATPLSLPGRAPGISLSITDDGPGFPPGTTDKVFERFYRADPSRTGAGSGLGLAIVRELARAHGGEAWAENVTPHGARVAVLLPVQPIVATAPKPSTTAEE